MCKEESATPETNPVNIEVIGGLTSYTAGSPASKLAVILISDIYGRTVGLKNWVRITFAAEPSSLEEALERILQQRSGFIDIDNINPDAWPALIADLSIGENGIVSLAFGEYKL
ncbi:uncharacterized protein LOC110890446 [Helianthus annuus]|uniref:uncharacterized protein LOC110890446 n=1 Tax=Helianthus annuus TaxID=4232 RepID=UPI0016532B76|nr:uncharacterized protein LOC110890446 [Helianthus annuus]XP_035844335.1 uncharacterized protein LOC110890446 [Helianthus annuus]